MLVEINLLPKKEPKKISFLLIGILFILLLAAGSIFFSFQYKTESGKLETLKAEIQSTKELAAAEEQKIAVIESSNSAAELEKMVKWAEEYPIETVSVLRQLISMLPDRGFIQSFTYNETGLINLMAQFDTLREASYYLNELTESAWISDAKLLSLETAAVGDEAEATTPGQIQAVEDIKGNKLNNDPFLPRYVGNFEIKLNIAELKKAEEEKENTPEDGEASK